MNHCQNKTHRQILWDVSLNWEFEWHEDEDEITDSRRFVLLLMSYPTQNQTIRIDCAKTPKRLDHSSLRIHQNSDTIAIYTEHCHAANVKSQFRIVDFSTFLAKSQLCRTLSSSRRKRDCSQQWNTSQTQSQSIVHGIFFIYF